jgi:hypothetical protein
VDRRSEAARIKWLRERAEDNYSKVGRGKLPWSHSWMRGASRGTSGKKVVYLNPLYPIPDIKNFSGTLDRRS